eukprot:1543142-Rhodomonas_salina.2
MNLRGERPLCLLQLLRIARDLQSCLWVLVGAGTGICEHANECVVLCGERSLDVAGADDQDVTEACVDQRLRVRRILRTEDGKHVGMHLHDDLLERSHREARPSAACLHSSQREVDEHRLHNHGCASGAGGKSTMFCFCGALSFEATEHPRAQSRAGAAPAARQTAEAASGWCELALQHIAIVFEFAGHGSINQTEAAQGNILLQSTEDDLPLAPLFAEALSATEASATASSSIGHESTGSSRGTARCAERNRRYAAALASGMSLSTNCLALNKSSTRLSIRGACQLRASSVAIFRSDWRA